MTSVKEYQPKDMEWCWYAPMTPRQSAKLVAGIKSAERFQLNLAVETVTYDQAKGQLTVTFPKGTMNPNQLREHVSCYVNGFYDAVKNS